MSNVEHVNLCGEIRRETELAILFWDGSVETWIPKSLLEDRTEYSDETEIVIPRWLAEQKELI